MKFLRKVFCAFTLITVLAGFGYAQTGNITETGDSVLDPNGDGFISTTNAGFNADGYDIDEFEIKMFGIPIFGDGEALRDNANGQPCGVSDLALDSAGYALYAGYDNNQNLIFRFRLAGDAQSVQSYTVLIDTDNLIGPEDPNSNSENPGFEIDITLIQRFGVYVYDIDGIDTCPTPLMQYDVATHQQKSTSSQISCDDQDYFLDFYVPFTDLEELFGIVPDTELRFAGVTNISATCALDGSISDIGGVNDADYEGCFTCAMLDLAENQCPAGVSNLCESCAGFPLGVTETPVINLPVLVGDFTIDGTAEEESFIYIEVYSQDDILFDRDTITTDINGTWMSNEFSQALNFGDSIIVNALLPGRCQSGLNDAGLSFAIVSPNQPPQLIGSQLSIGYEENSPPVLVSDDIDIIDDNETIVEANVSISQSFQPGFDFLEVTYFGNLIGQYDESVGILSISGAETIENYVTTLQSITFFNSNENPNLDIKTLSFFVSDGTNTSPEFQKNLLIVEINDPPVIIDDNDSLFVNTNEDVPIEICIDVSDVDSDLFEIESLLIKNDLGTVEIVSELCFLFTPHENLFGTEFVEVTLCDVETSSECDITTVVIEVSPVNDPPVIVVIPPGNPPGPPVQVDSASYTTEKNTTLNFCLEGLDIDGDEIDVSAIEFTELTSSSFTHDGGLCFTYIPETNLVGFEFINMTICDDADPTGCTEFVVTIEIIATNDAPVIEALLDTIFVETLKNIPVEVCVVATDPDGDLLNITSIDNSADSQVEIGQDPLCFTYTPPPNFSGEEFMEIIVCDDVNPAKCDTAIVAMTVIPTNNPPTVVVNGMPVDSLYFDTDINTVLDFCLEVQDPDNNGVVLTSFEFNDPSVSTILQVGDLCGQYTPAVDFTGQEFITAQLCDDGNPQQCIDVIIEIEVFPVNRPPRIVINNVDVDTLNFQVDQDKTLEFCLDIIDEDSENVRIEEIETIQQGGFYQPLQDNCIEFTPEANFTGNDIHIVTVCDGGDPLGCDQVVVVIEVLPVNTPPIVIENEVEVDTLYFEIDQDQSLSFCLDVDDLENDELSISEITIEEEGGVLEIGNEDLCLVFSALPGFVGRDIHTVTVCDNGDPQGCDQVVIVIDVLPTNSPPIVIENEVEIDTLFFEIERDQLFNFCLDVEDFENDEVGITQITTVEQGGFYEIAEDNICIDFTPEEGFIGRDIHIVTVCDNGVPMGCDLVVVIIDIFPVNDPPVITLAGTPVDTLFYSVGANRPLNLCLEAMDPDNNLLSLLESSLVAENGLVSESSSGELCIDYIPSLNFLGVDYLNPQVCDDGSPGKCDSVVIEIEVIADNTAPEFLNAGASIDTLLLSTIPNTPLEICLEARDEDNDELTLDFDQAIPDHGGVSASETGLCINYMPEVDFLGEDWFSIKICDDRFPFLCDELIIGIEINSNNTAPSILFNSSAVDSIGVNGFEEVAMSLSFEVADNEDDQLVIQSATLVEGAGSLATELANQLTLNYTPDDGSTGLHRINLEVCDDGLPVLCDSISVAINVTDLNLAPIGTNDTFTIVPGIPLRANVLDNDSDPDGDSIYIDLSSLILPLAGRLELSEIGEMLYEADAGFDGFIGFDYTICDFRSDQLCSEASVTIEVPPVERAISPFQALSPNGDGLNDFWLITDIEFFPDNTIMVFDRWNNLVYEAHSYDNQGIKWIGQANRGVSRKDLPDGTYFYIINPGDGSSSLSGNITLRR